MESNNAAALREALDCALVVLDGFGYGRPDCVRAAYDCKTALAAPPRNCDRFRDWEETLSAFREETGNRKPLELWLKSEIQEFAIWLFATASEQKGETDGSK